MKNRKENPITGVAIETRFIGPSNVRGARIKAFTESHSITIPYPHEYETGAAHEFAARALANKMKWTGTLVGGGTKKGYAFVFVDGPFGKDDSVKRAMKKNPERARKDWYVSINVDGSIHGFRVKAPDKGVASYVAEKAAVKRFPQADEVFTVSVEPETKNNPRKRRTGTFTPALRDAFERGGDQVYRGYRIVFNAIHSEYYISKDGFHIATCRTLSDAKKQIDAILGPINNPRKRRLKLPGEKSRRVRGVPPKYNRRKLKRLARRAFGKTARVNPTAAKTPYYCIEESKTGKPDSWHEIANVRTEYEARTILKFYAKHRPAMFLRIVKKP